MQHSFSSWPRLGLLALLFLSSYSARAQSVGVGTATPDAKAALDIRATDKGLLIPRLTAAQRAAIAAPPQGLMVYQTDGSAGGGPGTGFWYFGGAPAAWVFINPAGGGADNLGNHTATQALNLQAQALTGTGTDLGTTVGVGVRADGGLNLGQNGGGANVFLGYQAGQATTPSGTTSRGRRNMFSGYQAGASNTTGGDNLFSGYRSGFANTTGNTNLFMGYLSGASNTTANLNQFVGHESGAANTTGNSNHFVGYRSGYSNTTGSRNQFEGYASGFGNTSASDNQFSGYQSGINNTTGSQNLFVGSSSGGRNTAGSLNQFIGYESGYSNTTGFSNQFSGYESGINNTTGSENTFSGFRSGRSNTTGSQNTFSGLRSGFSNTTGSGNWAFGFDAGPTTGNLTNAGAIGTGARVSRSNSLVLGGLGPNAVNVGIGTSSPSQKLEVIGNGLFNGNLTATGTVNMGWTQVSGTYDLFGRAQDIYILACPSGMRALGGGGGHRDNNIAANSITVNYSGPDPADPERKWRVILSNSATGGRAVRVYCNCARIGP